MTTTAGQKSKTGLTSSILGKIADEQEQRNDPTFVFKLERTVSVHLQQRRHNSPRHNTPEEQDFFLGEILDPIQKLSMHQEDEDGFLENLWLKLVQSTCRYRTK